MCVCFSDRSEKPICLVTSVFQHWKPIKTVDSECIVVIQLRSVTWKENNLYLSKVSTVSNDIQCYCISYSIVSYSHFPLQISEALKRSARIMDTARENVASAGEKIKQSMTSFFSNRVSTVFLFKNLIIRF